MLFKIYLKLKWGNHHYFKAFSIRSDVKCQSRGSMKIWWNSPTCYGSVNPMSGVKFLVKELCGQQEGLASKPSKKASCYIGKCSLLSMQFNSTKPRSSSPEIF